MPILIDASSPARVTGNDGQCTTASFTPPAGSRLVVELVTTDHPQFGDEVCTSSGLTFTLAAEDNQATGHSAYIWASSEVPSATARTVTAEDGNLGFGANASCKVWVVTGADSTDPIGNSGAGTSTVNNETVTGYTSSAAGSWGFCSALDTAHSAGATSTDTYEAYSSAFGWDGLHVRKSAATGSSGVAVTFNLDANTTTAAGWRWCAVEILAAGGSPPAATSAPLRRRRSGLVFR